MVTENTSEEFPESGYLKCRVDLLIDNKYLILKFGNFYKFETFADKVIIEGLHFYWHSDRLSHAYYYTNFFEEKVYQDKELRKIKLQILNQSA